MSSPCRLACEEVELQQTVIELHPDEPPALSTLALVHDRVEAGSSLPSWR